MEGYDYLLSICIPTYNRLFKLRDTIDRLLQCQDPRFNIIISDNNSTDGTKDYLLSLKHEKVFSIVHDSNITPAYNGFCALNNSKGLFSLFLLDKDSIEIQYLKFFLDILESANYEYGYCDLGKTSEKMEMERVNSTVSSFFKMAYLCRHPSGYFFKSDIIKKELEYNIKLADENFPFSLDLICAHLVVRNKGGIAHIPIIQTEDDYEAARVKSLSYNIDNLWFAPKQVIYRYEMFLSDLSLLKMPIINRFIVKLVLIKRCYDLSTFSYSGFLTNELICSHYGISIRKLSFNELIRISRLVYNGLKNKNGVISCCLLFFYSFIRLSIFKLGRLAKKGWSSCKK